MARFAATLVLAALALGCVGRKPENDKRLAEVTASYEKLAPAVAQLKTALAEVHKGVEDIASAAPGGGDFRGRLLATEEVLGVTDARVAWIAGELAAAKASGKRERLVAVQEAITATSNDIAQVQKATFDLMHEKPRLQTIAALTKTALEKAQAYKRVLPSGVEVRGAVDGLEARLIAFIEDRQKKPDKTTFHTFDRIFFLGGSAALDVMPSRDQLNNVAQILASFPGVTLKIGGFTDNSGDAATNKKASGDRARAIKEALTQMSVAGTRLQADGYGPALPVCPANDSDGCRGQNRRVAALVTAK